MDSKAVREQIVAEEWEMFQTTHNKGGRAACQDDYRTFYNMRMAQFDAWSDAAACSYLEDLCCAKARGRNLVAEKYLHMMKSSHPDEYEAQRHLIPRISPEQAALAAEICDEMIAQTIPLREAYPHVDQSGRPLFSNGDKYGFTSVQTYQLGELLTYSEKTLRLLKEHLFALKAAGRSLAKEITSCSVCSYGFSSLEEAEAFLAAHQRNKNAPGKQNMEIHCCTEADISNSRNGG